MNKSYKREQIRLQEMEDGKMSEDTMVLVTQASLMHLCAYALVSYDVQTSLLKTIVDANTFRKGTARDAVYLTREQFLTLVKMLEETSPAKPAFSSSGAISWYAKTYPGNIVELNTSYCNFGAELIIKSEVK